MSFDFAKMLELNSRLDRETLLLLGQFVIRALKQRDTNDWVKKQLRFILNPPSVTGPIHVEVRPCPPEKK
jgi:hypothetical protein